MHLSEMHVCFQSLQICLETSFLGTASQLTGKDRVGRTALSGELGSDRGTGTDVKSSALAKLCAPGSELMCVR